MEEPEIAIVVEGGMVVSVATTKESLMYRIIDMDVCRQDSGGVGDMKAGATNIDLEEYTDEMLKEKGLKIYEE